MARVDEFTQDPTLAKLDGMEGPGWASPHVIVGCRAGVALAGRATDVGAPVLTNRTSVGLDVHACSVVVCGLDGQSGEVFERRLPGRSRGRPGAGSA
jgi:hypothetical protein